MDLTPMMKSFVTNSAIISSNGPIGNNVMTCAWINRVSMNPAIVSIAVSKERSSYQNIKKSKEFGVNICSSEQSVLSSVAGSNSGKEVDKIKVLKELGVKFYNAKKIKCLMIEDCPANMECKVINEIEAGDHVVFIGEVIEGKASDKEPLLYAKGRYWKTGSQVEKPNSETLEKIRKLIEKNKK